MQVLEIASKCFFEPRKFRRAKHGKAVREGNLASPRPGQLR